MNPDLEIFLGIGAAVLVIAVLAAVFYRGGRPASSLQGRNIEAKLDVLARRVDDVEKKAGNAEHDIRNVRMSIAGLATKDSVTQLAVQVAEMRSDVRGVATNTAATTRAVELIQSFLMRSAADAIAGNKAVEKSADRGAGTEP